ncbi:MAG TPA: hypothetical protein VKE97_03590, partial [Acidimicrobiia bacterium]|nr:hypothetical protein [Acidimicrobiia bacterium]
MLAAAAVAGARLGEHLGADPALAVLVVGALGAGGSLFAGQGPARLTIATIAVLLVATATMQRALDGQEHSPLAHATSTRAAARITATLTGDPDGERYYAEVLARVDRIGGRSAGHRTVLVTAGGDAAQRLRLLESGDEIEVSGWLQPLTGYDRRLRWRHAVAALDAVELTSFEPARS